MNFDFSLPISENRKRLGRPFLAAHRGTWGANIPCNTLASYQIALDQGADIIEIDISRSKDGVYFAFHPGMEPVFLCSERRIPDLTADEVCALPLVNSEHLPTSYRIPTLQEVLALLKGKAYINVDKFWMDIPGITAEIYRAGVEKQVIVKTHVDEESLLQVERYAPDLMFLPIVRHTDTLTERMLARKIRYIGIEALFDSEKDEVCSPGYLEAMHEKGLLVWSNAIVYNEKAVISAHHTDDVSLTDHPDKGWGWLCDRGFDFIQTDWILPLRLFLASRDK